MCSSRLRLASTILLFSSFLFFFFYTATTPLYTQAPGTRTAEPPRPPLSHPVAKTTQKAHTVTQAQRPRKPDRDPRPDPLPQPDPRPHGVSARFDPLARLRCLSTHIFFPIRVSRWGAVVETSWPPAAIVRPTLLRYASTAPARQ